MSRWSFLNVETQLESRVTNQKIVQKLRLVTFVPCFIRPKLRVKLQKLTTITFQRSPVTPLFLTPGLAQISLKNLRYLQSPGSAITVVLPFNSTSKSEASSCSLTNSDIVEESGLTMETRAYFHDY